MKNNYCVYKHTNKINGKVYIGVTCQRPTKRWQGGNGYVKCSHFFNAIKKYGWKSFDHEILITGLTREQANAEEIRLIEQYHSADEKYGYNISPGGGLLAESVRRKMYSPEVREKVRQATIAFYADPEHRKEQSERIKATWDEKARKEKSKNMTRYFGTHESPCRKQAVNITDMIAYESLVEAGESIGVRSSSIYKVISGQRNSIHGTRWKYLEDLTEDEIILLADKTIERGLSNMAMSKKKIRADLMRQLEAQNKTGAFYESWVEDYINYVDIKQQLIDDIKKRGPVVTITSGNGFTKQCANDSIVTLQKVTSIMIRILNTLDLTEPVIDDNDKADSYL